MYFFTFKNADMEEQLNARKTKNPINCSTTCFLKARHSDNTTLLSNLSTYTDYSSLIPPIHKQPLPLPPSSPKIFRPKKNGETPSIWRIDLTDCVEKNYRVLLLLPYQEEGMELKLYWKKRRTTAWSTGRKKSKEPKEVVGGKERESPEPFLRRRLGGWRARAA